MRWYFYLFVYLFVVIISVILTPVFVLFRVNKAGLIDNGNSYAVEPRLPDWCSFAMTPDNSLWGDEGWKTKHCPNYQSYWGMCRWLWRNHGYGASWTTLGAPVVSSALMEVEGDKGIDRNSREGSFRITYGNFWQWKFVKRIPGTKYCIMLNFGWMLDPYIDDPELCLKEKKALFLVSPRVATYKGV